MASPSQVRSLQLSAQKVTLPSIPELYNPNFLDVLLPPVENVKPKPPSDTPTNPMMDALNSVANRGYTANNAQAFESTGSATLDAFNNLAQWSYSDDIDSHLAKSWAEDPELTLKLIWNIRSIHDGKAAREAFYRAFGWLYKHHPRTAISNLEMLVSPVCKTKKTKEGEGGAHGYWKDLSNILALATVDQLSNLSSPAPFLHSPRQPFIHGKKKAAKTGTPEERIKQSLERDATHKVKARKSRDEQLDKSYSTLESQLATPKYRALYIAVARLFAQRLTEDIQASLDLEKLSPDASKDERFALSRRISLAGKWAPTPALSHDRVTNLSSAIALLLFHTRDEIASKHPEFRFPSSLSNSSEPFTAEQVVLLRSYYQRHVLTYLRRVTRVPEPLMSSNRWKEIKYNRVPSACMKNNTERFFQHDPEGFEKYLISVEEGRRTISGATLLPHELVTKALECTSAGRADGRDEKFAALAEAKKKLGELQLRVVEAQWKTLREKLRESGALDNCLAICDVSGSMGSMHSFGKRSEAQPVQVAVALSLLVAQIAKPPFSNSFISFSERPQVIQVNPALNLGQQVDEMIKSDWGMNTDFEAVFLKLLLPLAVKNGLKQEDMVKRLFVFSDMQFDETSSTSADANEWSTNHDVIEREFKKAGYEMPQIVYWNLAGSTTAEVQSDREGVAMMSGYSPSMLKTFMGDEAEESLLEEEGWEKMETEKKEEEEEEAFNPINVMKKALNKASFAGLKVLD